MPTEEKNVVYHYTSHAAAMNIIRCSELWLTNIRFQNDEREWWWLFDHVKKYLQVAKKAGKPINNIIETDILSTMNSGKSISICTSCFSYKNDDSAQWDRYATGGRGVAIGFKIDYLKKAVASVHSIFGKVEYSQNLLENKIGEILACLEKEIEKTGRCSLRTMDDQLARHAVLFKNPTFESEEEFRIGTLGVPYTKYKYFTRDDTIVPYTPLPISLNSIVDICMGPKAVNESKDAWSLFLSQIGEGKPINDIAVRNSASSLR